MKHASIRKIEQTQMKKDVPHFQVGDTVRVHTRIIEGDKERVQMFTGTVIARTGSGLSETFSMHRVAYGEGMERVFPLHSPRIAMIEVMKEGDVRKSKLYYLRGTSGKAAKVKARLISRRKGVVVGEDMGEEVGEAEAEEAQAVEQEVSTEK